MSDVPHTARHVPHPPSPVPTVVAAVVDWCVAGASCRLSAQGAPRRSPDPVNPTTPAGYFQPGLIRHAPTSTSIESAHCRPVGFPFLSFGSLQNSLLFGWRVGGTNF